MKRKDTRGRINEMVQEGRDIIHRKMRGSAIVEALQARDDQRQVLHFLSHTLFILFKNFLNCLQDFTIRNTFEMIKAV